MPISDRRLFALALLAGASACHKPVDPAPFAGKDAERIECRTGTATAFRADCVIEREEGADGLALVVRHPDGGFRRLAVTDDGRGVVTADGAESAVVATVGGNAILVTVGIDAYRLPATIRPGSGK